MSEPSEANRNTMPERLEVRIVVSPQGARGRLVVRDAAGATRAREIEAATCEEAVDALALVAALALEQARAEERKQAEPVVADAGPRAVAPARDRGTSARVGVGGSTSALALSGLAPELLPGVQLAVSVGARLSESYGLALRTGVRLAAHETVRTADGNATFEWRAGFLELCAEAVPHRASLALCATFERGWLQASGSATTDPAASERSWVAVGPSIAGQWAFLPPLFVHLGVGALFPFVRDRFLLGTTVVHTVPALAVRGEVGLGVRFW
jgi:hypothetical protein